MAQLEQQPGVRHRVSYPMFIWRSLGVSTDGNLLFYAWMTFLTAVALVGANAWAHQVVEGMIVTNMTDHVSWGLYIANFTFLVGVAAGGVMMVIPAYLFWHMIPGLGRFNFPISMLAWDFIVLNGYLLLNLHIVGYLLYMRFIGRAPDPRWYVPFVMISIVWAISIHTVTAFLYCGLGGRALWNSALLAPRFLASAFVSGPAFIVITLMILRRLTGQEAFDAPMRTLVRIIRVTILINLLMIISEVFTEFYAGGAHTDSARYLYLGLHGYTGLLPWTWTAMTAIVVAALMFLHPQALRPGWFVVIASVLAFAGIWIEKGMGLIVPGFIPSTLHQMVEYQPSLVEWKITAGVWAFGLIVYTLGVKLAKAVFGGSMRLSGS
jgi:molybdopterin-containing oxidoreductase family membrane subunit